MTSFIFWMIFIQVSIFFIVMGLLLAWIFSGFFRVQPVCARVYSRNRFRVRRPIQIQN